MRQPAIIQCALLSLPWSLVIFIITIVSAVQFALIWNIHNRTRIADVDLIWSFPEEAKIVQQYDAILWVVPSVSDYDQILHTPITVNDTTYIIYKRLGYVGTIDR